MNSDKHEFSLRAILYYWFIIGTFGLNLFIDFFSTAMTNKLAGKYFSWWDTIILPALILSAAILILDIVHHRCKKSVPLLILIFMDLWMLASMFYNQMFVIGMDKRTMIVYIMNYLTMIMFTVVFFNGARHLEREKFLHYLEKLLFVLFTVIFALNIVNCILYFANIQSIHVPIGDGYDVELVMNGSHGLTIDSDGMRFQGTYGYPNYLGFECYLSVAVSLFLLEQKRISFLPVILNAAMSVILLKACECRGAMICMAVIALYAVVKFIQKISDQKKRKIAYIMLIIAIVAMAIAGLTHYVNKGVFEMLKNDSYNTLNAISSNRLLLWKTAWTNTLTEKPLTGYGLLFWNNPVNLLTATEYSHNLFMSILLWGGVPCLILFTIFCIVSILKIVKNRNIWKMYHADALVLTVGCIFLQTMLDQGILGNTYPETGVFWLVLGFLVFFDKE